MVLKFPFHTASKLHLNIRELIISNVSIKKPLVTQNSLSLCSVVFLKLGHCSLVLNDIYIRSTYCTYFTHNLGDICQNCFSLQFPET